MKRLPLLLGPIALFGLIGLAAPAFAQTILPGDLIKGSGSAIYYYAHNGTRFVFPTEATFKTWFSDFSSVKTLSDVDLAAIPLGGNVTYHAGSRMVKMSSDPKVYAVANHGVLRWVETEEVATALYGRDWATRVDDLQEGFFFNYQIGAPIASVADFSVEQERAAASLELIQTDSSSTSTGASMSTSTSSAPMRSPTSTPAMPPASTSISPLTLTSSQPTVQLNDILTLNATFKGATPQRIELYFDSALVTTCTVSSCSGQVTVPESSTLKAHIVEARAVALDNSIISQTLTLPITPNYSDMVHIRVGQSQIMPTQQASAMETVDAGLFGRLDIVVDGADLKGCRNGFHSCGWSDYLSGPIGSVHDIFGVLSDGLGRQFRSASAYITLIDHEVPHVDITPAKTQIYAGETVDMTVTASDSYGITSMDVLKDGVVLKHCVGAAPCTATTGPWTASSSPLLFVGQATDAQGYISTSTAADAVTVVAR